MLLFTKQEAAKTEKTNGFFSLFSSSAKELNKTKTLVMVSLLTSIAVVLGFLAIQVTPAIKISFAFIANELTGLLFGPVVGGIMGGVADILKYIAKPTGPFFFGFTLNAIIGGIIYGIILYKKPVRLGNIILAKIVVMIIVDLLLTTLWLNMMYGYPYLATLITRLGKEAIMLPIETALFYIVARQLEIPFIKRLITA